MAWFGHSGSHTSQLMHSSVISRAMLRNVSSTLHAVQARKNARIDEVADIASQGRDLAHHGGGDEHVLLARREEDGFDVGIQLAVHARHLELILEIGYGAQTAQDDARALAA